MKLLNVSFLLILLLCAFLLSRASESAEQPAKIEPPKRHLVIPHNETESSNPNSERDEKQRAAAEEAARQKQLAAEELKYRREADEKQIKIQER